MSEHKVAFYADGKAVVCTCGDYFGSQPLGMTWFSEPLSEWAKHLRETNGLNLQDAYEAGWHDHYLDFERQSKDPNYPVGAGKRIQYPTEREPFTTEETHG